MQQPSGTRRTAAFGSKLGTREGSRGNSKHILSIAIDRGRRPRELPWLVTPPPPPDQTPAVTSVLSSSSTVLRPETTDDAGSSESNGAGFGERSISASIDGGEATNVREVGGKGRISVSNALSAEGGSTSFATLCRRHGDVEGDDYQPGRVGSQMLHMTDWTDPGYDPAYDTVLCAPRYTVALCCVAVVTPVLDSSSASST